MKFLLDENIGKKVAQFLFHLGHSVSRIREINPGIDDYSVLDLALSENAILITADKDYGALVFKGQQPHSGVIFLRVGDQSSDNKIRALKRLLSKYKNLENKFIVVKESEGKIKIKFSDKIRKISKENL